MSESGVTCFLSDDFESLMPLLDRGLTPPEKKAVRALLSASSQPSLREFGSIQTLEELGLKLSAQWLGHMLADRRYKSLMQPIVSAANHDDILGYEFLIRGLHTDGVEISAPTLFETADAAGMLYALDMAAGETAARTAKGFDLKEKVFVNVLPRTIGDDEGFEAWLANVLGDASFAPGQVVFEIVESQQLSDVASARKLIESLHERGIMMALDDFGTGFNNLATLTDIQPDYIKLDKSLTKDVINDGRKWTLIANIIDSAKQSNIQVIAEGVEDLRTARALESAGADYMQGYLFGRPADKPLEAAE
ncbi:EAL domain-containing protein [Kordiimonas sp. A6E486]|nr:EAL domain-containing protein [Kordiimonas marina]